MKSFTELSITADDALREHLIGILSQLGFEGFWEDGKVLRAYIATDRWSDAMLEEVERIIATVHRSSTSAAPTISLQTIENKNWNEEWERTIQPIHVTDRIVIAPTWHPYTPQAHEVLITIDPKMSFGTGYHETTRLVLRMMEETVRPGITLLDVGTGTGILAIAGIKLGATSAVALDNDSWAYENAVENVRLNSVEKHVQILLGDLSSVAGRTFNMIVANIQRSVIEPLVPQMRAMLAPGGKMILSGLLLEDEEPIARALLSAGCIVVSTLKENEWVALLCEPR
jgi:ribosomal protein L11 methyltransferase